MFKPAITLPLSAIKSIEFDKIFLEVIDNSDKTYLMKVVPFPNKSVKLLADELNERGIKTICEI